MLKLRELGVWGGVGALQVMTQTYSWSQWHRAGSKPEAQWTGAWGLLQDLQETITGDGKPAASPGPGLDTSQLSPKK